MAKSKIQAPKGTRDLFSNEGKSFLRLEYAARRIFETFGFEEVRTPLFESVDLFSRSLGATSDVVEKEMFTFTDRGERHFALRPEGTAGIVRHFIEHHRAAQGGEHRLFYMGPMFRAERPQAGRYRQFWQIGSEHFGPREPATDASTVLMAGNIIRAVGIQDFQIQINSLGCGNCRPKYRKSLYEYLKSKEAELTDESKRRMEKNPLRVLDSKADGPKLWDAPMMEKFLCEECKHHHEEFRNLCKKGPYVITENQRLVRGLDYYSRSVFEIVSGKLGAQNAIAAGGRYDDLVAELGGPAVPAVGFALGMDRVVSLMENVEFQGQNPGKAWIIPLDLKAVSQAYELAQECRDLGWLVPPITARRKLKNQLSEAVEFGAIWAILIGEDEIKGDYVTVKNLQTREQRQMSKSEFLKNLNNPTDVR